MFNTHIFHIHHGRQGGNRRMRHVQEHRTGAAGAGADGAGAGAGAGAGTAGAGCGSDLGLAIYLIFLLFIVSFLAYVSWKKIEKIRVLIFVVLVVLLVIGFSICRLIRVENPQQQYFLHNTLPGYHTITPPPAYQTPSPVEGRSRPPSYGSMVDCDSSGTDYMSGSCGSSDSSGSRPESLEYNSANSNDSHETIVILEMNDVAQNEISSFLYGTTEA